MTDYSVMFVLTAPLLSVSIYYLIKTFYTERHLSKKIEFVAFAIYTGCLSLLFMVTRVPIVFLLYNITAIYLLTYIYYSNFSRRIAYTLYIYISLVVIEVFMSLFSGVMNFQVFRDSEYDSIIGLIITRLTIFVFSYTLYKLKSTKKRRVSLSIYYTVSSIIVLIGTLFLYLRSLNSSQGIFNSAVISGITVVFVNTSLIFFDNKMSEYVSVEFERDILKQQNIAIMNQTELVKQSMVRIKSIQHDMKNHIATLKTLHLTNPEEFMLYVDKITGELSDGNHKIYSECFIIDSIINDKLKKMNTNNIKVDIDIRVPSHIEFLAYDLTVILGNLLDNAIVALESVESNKTLKINIECDKGSLIIIISNSYDGYLVIEDNYIVTTKKDKDSHGMGLINVQRAVKKNGGYLTLEYQNKLFTVSIVIPRAC